MMHYRVIAVNTIYYTCAENKNSIVCDGMNAPQKKLARGCDWREHRLIDCGYGEPASGERETLDRDTEVTPRLCD